MEKEFMALVVLAAIALLGGSLIVSPPPITTTTTTTSQSTSITTSTIQGPLAGELYVQGNRIMANGQAVKLHGFALVSCEHVNRCNPTDLENDFNTAKNVWKANVIRYGAHADAWPSRQSEMLGYLDAVTNKAREKGVYLMLDYHGYTGDAAATAAAKQFWGIVAPRYKDNPWVFYEVLNEPHDVSWATWKANAESIIDTIRAGAPNKMVVVNGLTWGYDLSGAFGQPIAKSNVAYGTHPYPNKCNSNCNGEWDRAFGSLASNYPILATEFGWDMSNNVWGYGDSANYGAPLLNYLDSKNIGWTAWAWTPSYGPQLLSSYYQPTASGQTVLSHLQTYG